MREEKREELPGGDWGRLGNRKGPGSISIRRWSVRQATALRQRHGMQSCRSQSQPVSFGRFRQLPCLKHRTM
jgi:hypothetical protein